MLMMMMKKMQHQRQQQADHANGEQPEPGHPLPNLILVMVLLFPPPLPSHPPLSLMRWWVEGVGEDASSSVSSTQKGEMRDNHSILPFRP